MTARGLSCHADIRNHEHTCTHSAVDALAALPRGEVVGVLLRGGGGMVASLAPADEAALAGRAQGLGGSRQVSVEGGWV